MIDELPLKQRIDVGWAWITGKSADFPLRARIFHSVCLIVVVALAYNVPFNYLIGLPKISLASFVVLVIMSFLYYNSRMRGKVASSIVVAQITGIVLFSINYFLNSGIQGPTAIFFLLTLIMVITISPQSQYKIWIPINIILLLTLHAVEYFYPDLVAYTYATRFDRFVDISSACVVVSFLSLYCIAYIRRHYESEKLSAELKSKSIVEQNVRILKQNLELQRLNAEKNKLMSIIAHDLRSPLGSIQNSLEIITEYDLDSEDKQFIEKELLNTTKNTSAMLSRLLSWSKSQINGISVFPDRYNLAKLLENTLETERSIAAQKNIELTSLIDGSIEIYADGDMMELIVRNLVSNAIKFTHGGGTISVSAQVRNNECWLCIQDTGTGIPYEKQSEIFSLTAQSTYGTDNEKGLGLGLLLCKEFITAQAGRIWFESQHGKGTGFYISIPLFVGQVISAVGKRSLPNISLQA